MMPYRSPKQRRFIFSQAAGGVPWAIKFITDAGDKPPKVTPAGRREARKLALAHMKKKR